MSDEQTTSSRKVRICANCGAEANRLAIECPECKEPFPALGEMRRRSSGRRYVYGKRKAHLSQEAIWLLIVIIVGLLIVFGVQVIAFMRSKKLIQLPTPPRQMVACAWERPENTAPLRPTSEAAAAAGRWVCVKAQGAEREHSLRYELL